MICGFLEAGADKNYANYAPENYNKPLYMAAERGSLEMVRLLAEAGADIDAALTPKVPMPPWVLMPTLMPACASMPHGNAVKGLTALHAAALNGHSEVVRFLLSAGADQNAVFDTETLHGLKALHGAAWFGHVEAVQLLLQDGDKDVASAEGVRPLHLAACAVRVKGPGFGRSLFPNARGGRKVVKVLLEVRADVNAAARERQHCMPQLCEAAWKQSSCFSMLELTKMQPTTIQRENCHGVWLLWTLRRSS